MPEVSTAVVDVVADERIIAIGHAVNLDRPGDVPGLVQKHAFVRLRDADVCLLGPLTRALRDELF